VQAPFLTGPVREGVGFGIYPTQTCLLLCLLCLLCLRFCLLPPPLRTQQLCALANGSRAAQSRCRTMPAVRVCVRFLDVCQESRDVSEGVRQALRHGRLKQVAEAAPGALARVRKCRKVGRGLRRGVDISGAVCGVPRQCKHRR
jgi:hypothetical protein